MLKESQRVQESRKRLEMIATLHNPEELLKMIVERHLLSTEKRSCFTIRFHTSDENEKKECTSLMEDLTNRIDQLDQEIYDRFGIDKKEREQILRDYKIVYPNDWIYV